MVNIFNYIERRSPIHQLTGATKLIVLLLWSLGAMITYDTRILAVLPVFSIGLFIVSKIKIKDISFMLWFTFAFMVLNNVLIFLFAPQHGCGIYGTYTPVFEIAGRYVLTQEQLFYHLNLVLKYLSTIPIVLLFVCTTHPSEFAASLNRIGVKYSVAYSVSLALRYIPDIQREYVEISKAQQARGVEMSGKASLIRRLKGASAILIPMILLSMDKIEIISNAMELRGFGKHKKRTWYMARPFKVGDFIGIFVGIIIFASAIYMNHVNGSRFWNPFL